MPQNAFGCQAVTVAIQQTQAALEIKLWCLDKK